MSLADPLVKGSMMTIGTLLIVTALLWLNPAIAFGGQTKLPKQPVELTVEIISQNYCAVSLDSAQLEMNLKLRYANVGNQKLILYKGHDLFYQTRILSAFEGGARPYEVLFLNSRYFDEQFESVDQASPGKIFVTLPPGAIYEREMMVGIAIVSERVARGNFAIREGAHTLQLIVSTWYKSRSLAQKLRQQWQRKGLLWFDPLVSAPVRFVDRRPGSLAPCQ
jgi:hypothetical protein